MGVLQLAVQHRQSEHLEAAERASINLKPHNTAGKTLICVEQLTE